MHLPNLKAYGQRLPEDKSVLLISDSRYFELFNQRKKLGIRAIAYDLPVSETLKKSLTSRAKLLSKNETTYDWISRKLSKSAPRTRHLFDGNILYNHKGNIDHVLNFRTLKERFKAADMPDECYELSKNLIMFKKLATQSLYYHLKIVANSRFPKKSHNHITDMNPAPKLRFSFNQISTVLITKDKKDLVIPENRAVLFAPNVEYKAPQIPLEELEKSPRITLIL